MPWVPASIACLPRHCEWPPEATRAEAVTATDLYFFIVIRHHRSRSSTTLRTPRSSSTPTTSNCESVGSGFSWKCSVTPLGLCLTLADPANPKDTESASRKRNFVLPQGLILCRLSTHKEERSTGALHSRAHYERSNGFFYNPLPTARQQRHHRRRTVRAIAHSTTPFSPLKG